eukprot:m.240067 g.240067  ORF g.240067 m.240067 type:complete len:339 (-) comp19407_c0_seq6:129-1145(-)
MEFRSSWGKFSPSRNEIEFFSVGFRCLAVLFLCMARADGTIESKKPILGSDVMDAEYCSVAPSSCIKHGINSKLFIVISRQRTGTHFLAQTLMLNSHVYHGPEFLYKKETPTIQDFCKRINMYFDLICMKGTGYRDFDSYGGVMMHWDFIRPIAGKRRSYTPRDVYNILARSGIRIVLYERRNTLAQAVSVLLHRQYGYLASESTDRVHHLRAKQLDSSAEAIYHQAREISDGFASVRADVSRLQMEVPLQVMSVFYEDLVGLQGSASLQLHKFLGVRSDNKTDHVGVTRTDPTRKYLIKVHTGSVFQYMNNSLAEQVRRVFNNTPLAWMVTDAEQSV